MSAIEPFNGFLARVAAAKPEDYTDLIASASQQTGLSVEEVRAEFDRIQSYLLDYYRGVKPVHSFVNESGQVVDCVPFAEQPAVRANQAAGRPVMPRAAQTSAPRANSSPCPPGAVPLLRLTMERLLSHGSLDRFLGGRQPPPPFPT